VLGVDTQDSTGGARAFYRKWHWRHPSIADPNGSLAAGLAVTGLPTTFFLDRRHRVVAKSSRRRQPDRVRSGAASGATARL